MLRYLGVERRMSCLTLPMKKYLPSNSKPTGATFGLPLALAVATLASSCDFRYLSCDFRYLSSALLNMDLVTVGH
jgi:hypothetical protein